MKNLILTTFVFLSTMNLSAADLPKSETAPDGLECFANLTVPEFPLAALRAHVDGSVWVTIQVTPTGSPDKIETQVVSAWADAPKLLPSPVEKAIRASTFKPACYGKSVSTVFRYQLVGEPVANPKATSSSDNPRLMVIESHPAVMPKEAGKAQK